MRPSPSWARVPSQRPGGATDRCWSGTVAAWRPDVSNAADPPTAYRVSLKSLARRYLELSDEIADLDELINPIVEALAPQLLARTGIGIEVAGQLLVTAGDNPDRMTSE